MLDDFDATVCIGGPLHGEIVTGFLNPDLNAMLIPESWKSLIYRNAVDITRELRAIRTRYRRERIYFGIGALVLSGSVFIWEEHDRNDPIVLRMALGLVVGSACAVPEPVTGNQLAPIQ